MESMHINQSKLLQLAQRRNLANMTLREIGLESGIGEHPQLVRHHLHQLVANGFLVVDKASGKMSLASTAKQDDSSRLLSIPILGRANCGEALSFADDQIEGYLQVSSSLIERKVKRPYALRAVGDSMNTAKIRTFGSQHAGIDDGDYVIINGDDKAVNNNEYIVAVIDGLANIKKLRRDAYGTRLVSESRQQYPPIPIGEGEQQDFVRGKVVAVVKR